MEEFAEVKFLHQLGLTEQMVRDHIMLPDHVKDASLGIELHEAGDAEDEAGASSPLVGFLYKLNTEKLASDLHSLLSICVAGYAMQLRRYGRIVWDRQWQWSKTPTDGGVAWASDVPMHVASVSKLITAMAMTKLLHSRNISPDARILPWLPKYWTKGPGVDQITFRHLLTHTSGLVVKDEAGLSDFQFMKDQIAIGTTTVGKSGYRNMNYGLCRILISTIDAPYLFSILTPSLTDAYWDLTTIRYYARYVSENIFAPAGVTSTFAHTPDNALAYPFPATGPGWDSGDLTTMCGCIAWHLSVNDLLNIMATFRRRGTIVDPARAQTMLDRKFGLDDMRNTPMGRIYAKGGFWGTDKGRFIEQTNAIFLPKGMELVILANSPFCKPDAGFMYNVLKVIEDNIQLNLLAISVTAVGLFGGFALFRERIRKQP